MHCELCAELQVVHFGCSCNSFTCYSITLSHRFHLAPIPLLSHTASIHKSFFRISNLWV